MPYRRTSCIQKSSRRPRSSDKNSRPETFQTITSLISVSLKQNEFALKNGKKLIKPFTDRKKIECPWLHWRIKQWRDGQIKDFNPKGILLMQDWGNAEQPLHGESGALREICDALNKQSNDTTLRNLLAGEWNRAIQTDNWIVSNAVWGLRAKLGDKEAPKCGYLGAELHKRAFLTWGRLVVLLCEEAAPDRFTLVVAGEWASFSDFPGNDEEEDLAKYLTRWRNWATTGCYKVKAEELPEELNEESLKKCKGRAIYVPHPATWRRKHLDWTKGPQI